MLSLALVYSSLAGDKLTDEYLKFLGKSCFQTTLTRTLENQKHVNIHPHYLIQSKKAIRPNEFEVQLRGSSWKEFY
jgi:dsRNA-specific ribonuclease